MDVSRQPAEGPGQQATGPRARTRRLLLETASGLMQGGVTPSVTEAAEAAGVSRATAYRYFPSQAALVQAVVDVGLGPILEWTSKTPGAAERVDELIGASLPRIDAYEATFRAALKLTLDQWAKTRAGLLGEEPRFTRGHRIALLRDAIGPLRATLPADAFDRLAQALSLVFGVEALIVLKDIWGLDGEGARSVAQWAAGAMVAAAISDSGQEGIGPVS